MFSGSWSSYCSKDDIYPPTYVLNQDLLHLVDLGQTSPLESLWSMMMACQKHSLALRQCLTQPISDNTHADLEMVGYVKNKVGLGSYSIFKISIALNELWRSIFKKKNSIHLWLSLEFPSHEQQFVWLILYFLQPNSWIKGPILCGRKEFNWLHYKGE